MMLTSKQLTDAAPAGDTSCTPGNAGSIGRYLPTDNISQIPPAETAQDFLNQDFAASNSAKPHYAKVGNSYYIYWPPQDYCTTNSALIGQVNGAAENIVDNLKAIPN